MPPSLDNMELRMSQLCLRDGTEAGGPVPILHPPLWGTGLFLKEYNELAL